MTDLPFAYGPPPATARLRATPEDFQVDELLGFEPDGVGDHALLHVRKRNTNTDWLARQITKLAHVKPVDVGYCGLKDRNAVTTQWFSVNLSGKTEPDWAQLNDDNTHVQLATRHRRKLQRGAHKANRFTITLRELHGDRVELEQRLQRIAADGVPNYFGEQRFGSDAQNVERARALFANPDAVRDRHQRSILISAARSYLFNAVLARRVSERTWNRALDGEACMLDGTHSFFVVDAVDATLEQRIATHDVHPSGPLWGRGEPALRGRARQVEDDVLAPFDDLRAGLEQAGLRQERRALRLRVQQLVWDFPDAQSLRLEFVLTPGSYATTVLREVATWV
jgi:tRNA pseudouridine13 synthase